MVITALCSVRRYHPEQEFFVFGRFKEDKKALNLLEQHDIKYIHLDLSHIFDEITIEVKPSEFRTWPSEVNWWSKVYSLLLDRGYPYSCYLDGDMICVGELDLEQILGDTGHISAVAKPNSELNSGLIIMNNKGLGELDFWQRYSELYKQHRLTRHKNSNENTNFKGCWGCTDQPLFNKIIEQYNLPLNVLGNQYNHIIKRKYNDYLDSNVQASLTVEESKMLHIIHKPWKRNREADPYKAAADAYIKWWEFAEKLWPPGVIFDYFGKRRADADGIV